jgi:O-antigen ligase
MRKTVGASARSARASRSAVTQRRGGAGTAPRPFADDSAVPLSGRETRSSLQSDSRRPPDAFLVAAGISTLFWVWVVHTLVKPLAFTKPTLVMLGAMVTLWILDGDPRRRLQQLPRPMISYLIGLIALATISVPFSVHDGVSFDFLLKDYSLLFVWMVMLVASVRSLRDLEWLLGLTVAGAFVFAAGSWLIDSSGRLSAAGYYDPNDLATMLVCALPAAVHFLRGKFPMAVRVASGSALGFMVFAIIRSDSRGGFLGLVAVGLTILLLSRGIPRRTRIGALVVGGLVLGLGASSEYWERMRTILTPSEDYNFSGKNDSGRMEIWKRGLGYMVQGPFGVGLNAYGQAEGRSELAAARTLAGAGFKWSAAHNSFIQVAAELGVGGAFCMAGLFVAMFRRLIPMARRAPQPERMANDNTALAGTLLACLVGFSVSGFFVSFGYSTVLYLLLGLILGYLKLLNPLVGRPVPLAVGVRERTRANLTPISRRGAPGPR